MDEFEQDEKNREALTTFEINGEDCPLFHVYDNKHDLSLTNSHENGLMLQQTT